MDLDWLLGYLKSYFHLPFVAEHVCCNLYRISYRGNRVYGSLLRFLNSIGLEVVSIDFSDVDMLTKILVTK